MDRTDTPRIEADGDEILGRPHCWEKGGALNHHCPVCHTSLTNPKCINRCVGTHVEWCKEYHPQFHKIGDMDKCRPCRKGREERYNRHREICVLLKELKSIIAENEARPADEITSDHQGKSANRRPKKAKIGQIIRPADIEKVAQALRQPYPVRPATNSASKSKHRGKASGKMAKEMCQRKVEESVVKQCMLKLGIESNSSTQSSREAEMTARFRSRVRDALEAARNDVEHRMQRKAGFWYWVSKKEYNDRCRNGKIWSLEYGNTPAADCSSDDDGGLDGYQSDGDLYHDYLLRQAGLVFGNGDIADVMND